MFLHLRSIYTMIHEGSLWFVSDIASYDVSTGELFVNYNSIPALETKQHNSILHQFRKLETTYCLTPLDMVTPSCIGYILPNVSINTYSVIFSKRYKPSVEATRKIVIDNFLQLYELSKRYSRRKMRLCKAVFGAVTEKNLSVLVTSKSETLH